MITIVLPEWVAYLMCFALFVNLINDLLKIYMTVKK